MEAILKDFFVKYPMEFSSMVAVKMIHKKVEEAQCKLKEDKDSQEYLKSLYQAYCMIEDIFKEMGVNPTSL